MEGANIENVKFNAAVLGEQHDIISPPLPTSCDKLCFASLAAVGVPSDRGHPDGLEPALVAALRIAASQRRRLRPRPPTPAAIAGPPACYLLLPGGMALGAETGSPARYTFLTCRGCGEHLTSADLDGCGAVSPCRDSCDGRRGWRGDG